MKRNTHLLLFLAMMISATACGQSIRLIPKEEYRCGAQETNRYLPLLDGKTVGVVANQTSIIGETHLVDSLIALGINVKRIYTPEHGFRGSAGTCSAWLPFYRYGRNSCERRCLREAHC